MKDQRARADIASVLDQTLFVEAGAGTGKTSSLVARVLELVRRGVPIDRLAVITFTEAAASELRDRVRIALEETALHDETDIGWARRALDDLDAAAISTLHGFAHRVLAEHPLEAGLPPVIEVHSEIGTQVDFERRWRAFLDRFLDDPAQSDLVQRSVVCGIELRHLKTVARLLDDHWDRLPPQTPPTAPLAPVPAAPVLEPLDAALGLAVHCTDDADKLLGHLRETRAWAERLRLAESTLERLHLLVNAPRLGSKLGRAGNWPDGCLEQAREGLARAEEARLEVVGSQVHELLHRLTVELARFTMTGVAERRAAGRLHFHDLLVMCRDLLRASPAVRQRLRERYHHLLIDEFQDTDPLQIEIARLIASPHPDAGEQQWPDIATDPGRLFFVGDAKQAIYRFRRADIALFLAVRDRPDSALHRLSTNFRTVPGILEFVNGCFAEIMGEGVPGGQPAYEPLEAHRDPSPHDAPPVVVLGGPIDGRTAPERRATMSSDLAATLHDTMADQWPVFDRRTEAWRAPRWSDIAVLVPARTGLPELRAAFDGAGVPYRIEASSLVWVTQEVRELLATLRAIDDPSDELALVTALRSPAFGCGDDDLARYVAEGGRFDLTRPVPEHLGPEDPVVDGVASLRDLHAAAVWDEPSALVERVIRERHLMELATASTRPRDIWRRLRFVADQARAYADAEGGTLRDFLDWADLQADESTQASAKETILPETDDDAVRVMTIHASKGLEFPIVAVAGLDRAPNETRSSARILWGDGPYPEVHLRKGLSTRDAPAVDLADADQEGYEAWRLMYVATTRARDHLIVCLHHKRDVAPDKSIAARLRDIVERHPEAWRTAEPTGARMLPFPAPDEEDRARTPSSRDEWRQRRDALLAEARRPSVIAATSVAGLGTDTAADPAPDAEDEAEPWRRGRAGTSIGRAVHAVLQTVDLATGADVAAIAAAQAAAEGVPERTAEVERSARAALDAPSVRMAASRPHWREIYLGASIDGVLVEGYLDLLVDGPHGLEILDYKTDRAPDPDALADRYRLQMAAYALLVDATLGRTVHRGALVVLGPSGAVEVEVADLDTATEEVRRRLAESGRPFRAPTP